MDFCSQHLANIKQCDLFREFSPYEPVDATHVQNDNKLFLMLASNNYLGLTHCPAVQQAAIEAIAAYGTGSGGSRLTTGTHILHSLLEQELAEFKGTEAALVFNTGYMANVGAITALSGPGDVIFSDELNHASIIDGCRLSRARPVVFRHSDMEHLAECLAKTPCSRRRLIIVDGVFSMDGDIAPLDIIAELAERYDALVMVDDAHATGVIGPGGRGTAAYFGMKGRIQVQMGTFSKALGSEGGYIAGSRTLIEYLVNTARSFIFSTALSPATIAASRAALMELRARPELVDILSANARFVRNLLTTAGFDISQGDTPIIPIIIGSAADAVLLAGELKKEGLIISAIRPPTVPVGASRLRLTVSAAHGRSELAQAMAKLTEVAQRQGLLKGTAK